MEFIVNSSFLKPLGPINTTSLNQSQGQITGALSSMKKVCHCRTKIQIGESDSDSAIGSSVLPQLCDRFDALDQKIST